MEMTQIEHGLSTVLVFVSAALFFYHGQGLGDEKKNS